MKNQDIKNIITNAFFEIRFCKLEDKLKLDDIEKILIKLIDIFVPLED